MVKQVVVVTCSFLTAAALAGCSSDSGATDTATEETGPRIVQPGAPGEDARELTPEEIEDLEPIAHTPADVQFMQYMILHHRQALRMTALVPERTNRKDLPLLAERIDISQQDEIDRMVEWLEKREAAVPPPGGEEAHAGHLPGMLTEQDFERLEAAQGRRFDRLFLRSMIRHHEGALRMVTDLQASPGAGQEAEISVFAGHVVADQSIEINRMNLLLQELAR